MKILKYIAIIAMPLILSNCAKDEIDVVGLKDKLIGHWQHTRAGNGDILHYSFTKDEKFAYWYNYAQDPINNGEIIGEWTVYGENEIGLTYKYGNETRHEIVTVILTDDDGALRFLQEICCVLWVSTRHTTIQQLRSLHH